MSNISLQKSLRTCRVDTGWADKMQSDRFLNSCQLVCPTWNGMDQYGRTVCQDSFTTETYGCRSAMDRINVENYQRPQYFEYVNLDGFGVQGNLTNYDAGARTVNTQSIYDITGNAGLDYGATVIPKCREDAYARAEYTSSCGDPCMEAGMVKATGCKCGGGYQELPAALPAEQAVLYGAEGFNNMNRVMIKKTIR